MMAQYRVGIVACGGISRAHSNGYKSVPATAIVAAADISEDALKRYGEEYGVKNLYPDYEEMFKNEKLDIVSVCTYPTIRRDITVTAAKYGIKGIYCEKPMCMDAGEADEMVEACEESGAVLIVGHQRRFEDHYVKAKEIAHSGAIGDIYKIESACPGWDIFEWGTHWVDMARFFNNDVEAEWVLAQIDRRWDRISYAHRMETECIAHIGFKNGVRAIFESGDRIPDSVGFYNRIFGTEGIVEVSAPGKPAVRARVIGEADWIVPEYHGEEPFKLVIEALIESIETGEPHILSGASARKGQEIIMAAYQSARTGKLIELPLEEKRSPFGAMLERVGIPYVLDK